MIFMIIFMEMCLVVRVCSNLLLKNPRICNSEDTDDI